MRDVCSVMFSKSRAFDGLYEVDRTWVQKLAAHRGVSGGIVVPQGGGGLLVSPHTKY